MNILYPGDPVPDFVAVASSNPKFHFNTVAGRYLVLCFLGSASIEKNRKALEHMTARTDFFDDEKAAFFGISIDASDQQRLKQRLPGFRYFWDLDHKLSTLYGAMSPDRTAPDGGIIYRAHTLIIDPMMRLIAHIPLKDAEEHNRQFDTVMESLSSYFLPTTAPVLVLPNVFERDFCANLIKLYKERGGEESGYMTEKDGKTVGVIDHNYKSRKDFMFDAQPEFEELRNQIRARVMRRLMPEIHRSFQFNVTRMERFIVACYDSESKGFFRAHRDNTTKGTAHRRFACTINLNAEEYEGGELRFPEFGPRTYRAPTGGAVIFSCSLLHEAKTVTKGTRYAFLPFLYDEEAAKIREQNREFLTGETINKMMP